MRPLASLLPLHPSGSDDLTLEVLPTALEAGEVEEVALEACSVAAA